MHALYVHPTISVLFYKYQANKSKVNPFRMQYNHKAKFSFSSIRSRVAPEHNKYITENLDDYRFLFQDCNMAKYLSFHQSLVKSW